jgi:ethanolamine utilization protein EutQ (cupin superfamily)
VRLEVRVPKEDPVAVVLKKSKAIVTEPLDVGEGKLSLVDVIAQAEGAPVSAGICEIWASEPIEFDYDNDCAVCYMLEGSVTLTEGGTRHDFEPGDVVFVPQQADLKVSWDTSSYGRFFYVTYPHWR